jgi:hypothetical protein
MEKNNKYFLLAGLSLVCMVSGYVLSSFPFLIMLALAPLFKLYEEIKTRNKRIPILLLILLLFPIIISYSLFYLLTSTGPVIFFSMIYGIMMSLTFIMYWFTDTYSKNRLGFFTLFLYWLSMEYVAIKLMPEMAYFLLGTTWLSYPAWVAWNAQTGMMGISAWILTGNILLYYALFKGKGIIEGHFRPLTLVYVLMAICIPIVISYQFFSPTPIITVPEVIIAYSQPSEMPLAFKDYAITGEVFGRTSAWITVLIVLYSFVKLKIQNK